MMKCGGTGEEKKYDDETQAIVDQIKSALESALGKQLEMCKLISYKTQVVAGTNYFAKVQTGDNEFVHVRIFKGLPHTGDQVELADQQVGKAKEDPIEYF